MAINKEIKNCFDTMLLNEHYFLRSRIGFGGTLKYGLYDERINITHYEIDAERSARFFERDVQGKTRANYSYANIDISHGTPIAVMRENAREFDYSQKVAEFNNAVTNMQIDDAIEETKLQAELTQMAGQANAAGLRASGTASLIKSFSTAVGNYA